MYNLSEEEINNLFNYFDKDEGGFIDYEEFKNAICGNFNGKTEVYDINSL